MNRLLVPVPVILLIALLLLPLQQAKAVPFEFNTSDNEFDAGVKNQGWYSLGVPNTDANESYITGTAMAGGQQFYRSFFTFDLSSLVGYTVTSATLQLTKFGVTADASTETLGFYDVLTDAETLNNNVGPNETIYNDLGSGTSYGEFDLIIAELPDVLSFNLNSAAVADINAAAGGWFSIGGAHLSITSTGSENFFGGYSSDDGGGVQRLTIEATPNAVPEPATMLLLGSGLIGLAGYGRKKFFKK